MIICDVCRIELGDERYTGIFFEADEMLRAEVKMDFCRNCYRTLTAIVMKHRKPKVDASDMELTITDERDEKESAAKRLVTAKPKKESKKLKPVTASGKKTEEPKKTKYIDYGKIKALYDAGWKVPDIATDVRCGESTVYNYLAKLRKENV